MAAGGGLAAARDFASSITRSEAVRLRAFYVIAISFGLGVISIGTMLINGQPFLEDAGYSKGFAAAMITAASVPALLLKPVWGIFLDRANVQRISLVGFLVNAAGLLAIVLTVPTGAKVLVTLSFALLGAGWSGFIPLQEVVWATYFGRRYLGAVRSAGLPIALGISASAPLHPKAARRLRAPARFFKYIASPAATADRRTGRRRVILNAGERCGTGQSAGLARISRDMWQV